MRENLCLKICNFRRDVSINGNENINFKGLFFNLYWNKHKMNERLLNFFCSRQTLSFIRQFYLVGIQLSSNAFLPDKLSSLTRCDGDRLKHRILICWISFFYIRNVCGWVRTKRKKLISWWVAMIYYVW